MRPAVRALVWIWAIVTLVIAGRYGFLYAVSSPPVDGFEATDLPKPERARLVVAPLVAYGAVRDGDHVVYRSGNASEPRVARAIFAAAWNETGGYDVASLNLTNATEATAFNATWQLPATLGNGTGLYVGYPDGSTPHADGAPLVPETSVEGVVLSVEDAGEMLGFLALFAVSSLVPITILILSPRPRRTPEGGVWDPALVRGPPTTPCVDCGRPVSSTATFCLGCGAYLQRDDKGAPKP